ncbi:glycosyltransferase family 4 protein [Winogradskyella ursingii]|uniref:glycosyltransferase family 4 protein n=1 Tax=Winogradskyella ursingii TaxID=2686079 RepID=UPI0015C83A67|nr:glycosyltransferase family 4 protein [Winogradskyella ursingii]
MGLEKSIAVICNYKLLPERVGGMDYFFWAYDEALKAIGCQVDWYFPNISNHGEYHKLNIHSSNNKIFETGTLKNIQAQTVSYTHIVTHFVELCTSFYAKLKKYQPKAYIIAVDHNPRPLNGYSTVKKIKKKIKGRLYAKYINQFIGVSNYTSQAILNDFGHFLKPKTTTIYNGVLIDDIQAKVEKRALKNPKFLVASHLRFSKGIQDLIEAVRQISDLKRNYLNIDIYGEGPYEPELKNLVKEYQLQSCFNFKGSVSNLNKIYFQYDYMLQPTHMECFSLSILESLAANVPVVTTPVGGNEEVVFDTENGFIFPAKNIEALTTLLEQLISGEKIITTNTRTQIENRFSIDLMVANHIKLVE